MKRQRHRLLLLVLVIVITGPALGGGTDQIPDVIHGDPEFYDAPVWVSYEAARRPDGTINWDLLGAKARRIYQSVVTNPAVLAKFPDGSVGYSPTFSGMRPDCAYYGPSHLDLNWDPSRSSLRSYVRDLRIVLHGQVTAMKEGFLAGDPVTLLRVEVAHVYRNETDRDLGGHVFIPYPKVTLRFEEVTLCKGDPDYPVLPQVGDEILLFFPIPPEPADLPIFSAATGEMAIYRGEKATVLPDVLKLPAGPTNATALPAVEQMLRDAVEVAP